MTEDDTIETLRQRAGRATADTLGEAARLRARSELMRQIAVAGHFEPQEA